MANTVNPGCCPLNRGRGPENSLSAPLASRGDLYENRILVSELVPGAHVFPRLPSSPDREPRDSQHASLPAPASIIRRKHIDSQNIQYFTP